MTTSWQDSSQPSPGDHLECLPRFGTPRDHSRPTYGAQVATIAEALGTPLMPWQRYVADVSLEADPETGLLVYGEVDLLVPRQSGKTTLILGVGTHRAWGFGSAQNIVYTAQTRGKAREKWFDDHVPALQNSIFRRLIANVRLANDSEALYWRNGSKYGIESGTETAGHGSTLDLAFIDEAFSEVDSRKEDALGPTMITRSSAQIWPVSTAGTTRSKYLRAKVDANRARFKAGRPSASIAYFEWSAPDDADAADEREWKRCMPALGLTAPIESVRKEYDRKKDTNLPGFCRAYLNQWPDAAVTVVWVIPEADWTAAGDTDSYMEPETPRCLAVDVSPDRARASIAVSGESADGLEHVEVIDNYDGVFWIVDRLKELRANHHIPGPVILYDKPAGALAESLRAADVPILLISAKDRVDACATLTDKLPNEVVHIDQDEMTTALAGAAKKYIGGSYLWVPRGEADITPLCAVTGARWGAARLAESQYDADDSFL